MKNLLYHLSNQGVNLSAIWADCSIFLFILLLLCVMAVIVIAKNYCKSLEGEYLLRSSVEAARLIVQIDKLTEENKKLSEFNVNWVISQQNEYIDRLHKEIDILNAEKRQLSETISQQIRKRDEKGHFIPITGKGHKKRDWTTATEKELITEAKRRYKKGDEVFSLLDNDPDIIISNVFILTKYNEVVTTETKSFGVLMVYSNGRWSKKVPAKN